jgi:hypothetical protein
MGTKMAVVVVSAALLSTLAVRVSAHHGFAAEFDATSPITLKGVITKIERLNPHGWIYVDVKGQDGQVKNWAVETVGPSTLARRGVRKDSLPIGVGPCFMDPPEKGRRHEENQKVFFFGFRVFRGCMLNRATLLPRGFSS